MVKKTEQVRKMWDDAFCFRLIFRNQNQEAYNSCKTATPPSMHSWIFLPMLR